MRLFISADIEGIVNVTSYDQTQPGAFEYEAARRWMTDTVLAAVEAAHGLGCEEIIVADSHHNGQNILPDLLPDHVRLVRSWPRPLSMMQGIEDGPFDGCMLLGYHTGSMTAGGNFAHNFSGHLRQILVDGEIWTETSVSAAIAGHFGVPVWLVSGDDVYCAEARRILGDVEAVAVKTSLGRVSSCNPATAVAHRRIREGVARAFARRGDFRPHPTRSPMSVELSFRQHIQAEVVALLPNICRTGAHEVHLEVADILELTRFLEFLNHYDLAKFG